MGKAKRKKYQPKPKAIRLRGYFNKEEVQLIDFVATKLLKVSVTQFVKGACVEMAQAALNMAQEKAAAEGATNAGQEGAADAAAEASGSEQPSDSEGTADTTPGDLGAEAGAAEGVSS